MFCDEVPFVPLTKTPLPHSHTHTHAHTPSLRFWSKKLCMEERTLTKPNPNPLQDPGNERPVPYVNGHPASLALVVLVLQRADAPQLGLQRIGSWTRTNGLPAPRPRVPWEGRKQVDRTDTEGYNKVQRAKTQLLKQCESVWHDDKASEHKPVFDSHKKKFF